ncbi:Anthranilate synthase [Pseudonocardia sp. Ae707_Ps1]|nr:Anthranilate synthase [Pseudonocardia sp. Ae707_Ps1]
MLANWLRQAGADVSEDVVQQLSDEMAGLVAGV